MNKQAIEECCHHNGQSRLMINFKSLSLLVIKKIQITNNDCLQDQLSTSVFMNKQAIEECLHHMDYSYISKSDHDHDVRADYNGEFSTKKRSLNHICLNKSVSMQSCSYGTLFYIVISKHDPNLTSCFRSKQET